MINESIGISDDCLSLSGKDIRTFEMIYRVAEAIDDNGFRTRLCACLIFKNQYVLGINQRKTDTFHARYTNNEEAIYRHAESDAIKRGLKEFGTSALSESTLYVLRLLRNDTIAMAKPCCTCQSIIREYQIPRVLYTDHAGKVNELGL